MKRCKKIFAQGLLLVAFWALLTAWLVLAIQFPDLQAQTQRKTAREELARLQGIWIVTALTSDGMKEKNVDKLKLKLIVVGKKYLVRMEDKIIGEGVLTLDPGQNPKAITQHHQQGDQKGKTSLGIYHLQENRLTLCMAPAGSNKKPTAFQSKEGSGLELTVCKRETE